MGFFFLKPSKSCHFKVVNLFLFLLLFCRIFHPLNKKQNINLAVLGRDMVKFAQQGF